MILKMESAVYMHQKEEKSHEDLVFLLHLSFSSFSLLTPNWTWSKREQVAQGRRKYYHTQKKKNKKNTLFHMQCET